MMERIIENKNKTLEQSRMLLSPAEKSLILSIRELNDNPDHLVQATNGINSSQLKISILKVAAEKLIG